MDNIIISPATRSDAADLAILDNVASHGLSMWFWQSEVDNGHAEDAFSLGRQRFGGDDMFGWKNAAIGRVNGTVVGSVTGYVMPEGDDGDADKIKQTVPPFVPVFELFEHAIGSFFIDSMAVYEEFRGCGFGKSLFQYMMQHGRESGHKRVMLVCEDTNQPALKLYQASGFNIVDDRPYISFGNKNNVNKWLLMAAEY